MQISWHYFFPVLTKAKFNVILYNLEMFRFLCLANCWRVSFRFGWFMWILTREWVSAASSDGPCKSFSFVRSINLWKYINCCIWRGLWFGYAYVWFIITKHKALAKVQPKCKLLIAFEHFNRNLSIKRFLRCAINHCHNGPQYTRLVGCPQRSSWANSSGEWFAPKLPNFTQKNWG